MSVRPSFGRRILALLIDYALILGWMAVLGLISLVTFLLTGGLFNWLSLGVLGAELLGFVTLVLPIGIYLYLSEASPRQATVGKRVMGLRVVSSTSLARPSRAQILLRTVVKLLPWEFAHFFVWQLMAVLLEGGTDIPVWVLVGLVVADLVPVVYVLVVVGQKDRRGPHDLAAHTRVIRDRRA